MTVRPGMPTTEDEDLTVSNRTPRADLASSPHVREVPGTGGQLFRQSRGVWFFWITRFLHPKSPSCLTFVDTFS